MIPGDFYALRDRLDDALAQGEDATIEVLRDLEALTARTIEARDVVAMVQLRDQLQRLDRRVETSAAGSATVTGTRTTFTVLDRLLDVGRTAAELRASADVRDQHARVLKDQILLVLNEHPARPRELAARFGTGTPQVSRALRALIDEGHVAPAPRPATSSDGRGKWYTTASLVAAA